MIEMIVVAVIIAIVAAVAVPIYRSYIDDKIQEKVDHLAQTGAAAANTFMRRTGAECGDADFTVSDLNLFFPNPGDYTVEKVCGTPNKIVITDLASSISGEANF